LKSASCNAGGFFDLANKKKKISELTKKSEAPNLWDNPEKAKKTLQELQNLKNLVENFEKLEEERKFFLEMLEMSKTQGDDSLLKDVDKNLEQSSKRLRDLEVFLFLSGPHDVGNAYFSIQAGAGGTDAQDWAEMLLRMYTRWFEKRGFSYEIEEYSPGEEAGMKSCTILVTGNYAFGFSSTEQGIHRLVRLSPFNANSKRHTSFTAVEVIPQLEDDIKVEIDPKDLRIDTFRASGAGGQHVNKTDSAVRISHIPSGIVATCQSERSQVRNKDKALKMLKSKLHRQRMIEHQKQIEGLKGEQKDIGWGSQIRSYVFHPYQMVKDLRTGVETSNINAVMDGEIDEFVEAFLKSK